MPATLAPIEAKAKRYHFIDRLRVLAVMGVFFLHSTRFFAPTGAPIQNASFSRTAWAMLILLHLWVVPMLFFLSGMTSRLGAEIRSPVRLIRERFARLLVPYLFGVLFLVPPMSYLAQVHKGRYHGSLFAFWGHSLASLPWRWTPRVADIWGRHLWFLAFLFVFSMLALPLLALLRRDSGRRLVESMVRASALPGGIFLAALPLAAVHLLLRVARPAYCDWADFAYWLLVFGYGIILMSDVRLQRAVADQYRNALLLVALSALALVALHLTGKAKVWVWLMAPRYRPADAAALLLWSALTWSWMLFLVGVAIRRFDFGSVRLGYANEAVLPFYVLHQPVLFLIGFYVVRWPLGIPGKFLTLSTAALIITLASYELLIRRLRWLRFLFGMRPLPAAPARRECRIGSRVP